MRLIFLGTPAFAVPTLEHLLQAGHEVVTVVTQPDRPRGRGGRSTPPPVKESAARFGLPVFQPERIRRPENVEHLRALAVDAMVVVGYGQIIPQSIIDLPPHGIFNVHGSLLPKYRGASPIQKAILEGETRTGITIMQIDAGLDTGDMLLQEETAIGPDENAVELGDRLSVIGAKLMVQTLAALPSLTPRKQDSALASYAPLLKKEDGRIDWTQSAQAIHNRVRGLQPWPGAYTGFRSGTLHIWKSKIAASASSATPGTFLRLKPLTLACGSGALELLEVQLEGRKRMSAADFVNGQRLSDNESLGESQL